MRMMRLEGLLEKEGLDAFIIGRESSIFYFSGSTSGGLLILKKGEEPQFLVPQLNLELAREQSRGCRIKPYRQKELLDLIEKTLDRECNSIGVDELSLSLFNKLKEKFKDKAIRCREDIIWTMRRVKDPDEIKMLEKAGDLASIGMEAVGEHLREGVKENEIAAEATYAMIRNGAQDRAFPIIIASGSRSAYPHADITDRKLRGGDLVTVDIGAVYKNYRSDITRTFILGEPTKEQKEIFELVLEAKATAITRYKDGSRCSEVDGAARSIIKNAGYGEYFIHSLGHGIGLDVHEPPNIGEENLETLSAGNVVTNEPGIYIPKFGGVRIEDTILVSDGAPKKLTSFDETIEDLTV